MLYRGSDSFAGTTPNMQLIEELRADREQADIGREKEIARRDRAVVEAYKGLQEAVAARKKVFSGCAEIGGNWQLAKLKIIWVLTDHCLWAV